MSYVVTDLRKIVGNRTDQTSYHLASEDHFRVQIFNLRPQERLGKWKFEGNAIVTIISGEAIISVGDQSELARPMCQAIIPKGIRFGINAQTSSATVQIIWSPPFAKTEEVA